MNGGGVTIVYDSDGNRVGKTAGGLATQYLVDTLNPAGYAQVVDELVAGSVRRVYTYGLQRISQEQLIIISGKWTPSFYGYDGGSSVRALTDLSGIVRANYDYDAWGNTVTTTGSTPNAYLYRGEQFDADLGLYYLRARYFYPVTGRFLSRDPADGTVIDPGTLHKYAYSNGDPVNRVDPTGRSSTSLPLRAFAALTEGQLFWTKVAMAASITCVWLEAESQLYNGLVVDLLPAHIFPVGETQTSICGTGLIFSRRNSRRGRDMARDRDFGRRLPDPVKKSGCDERDRQNLQGMIKFYCKATPSCNASMSCSQLQSVSSAWK